MSKKGEVPFNEITATSLNQYGSEVYIPKM